MKTDIKSSDLSKLVLALTGRGNPEESNRILAEVIEQERVLDERFPERVDERKREQVELDAVILPPVMNQESVGKVSPTSILPDSDHIKSRRGRSIE